MSSSLYRKFMDYALGSGLVLILGFLSSPLNTRLFSPEEFGKFSMFNLWTNIILVLMLVGLDQSFIRYYHEENEGNRSKLLIETLKIPLLMFCLVTITLILFNKLILNAVFSSYSIQLLFILIINNLFSLLNRYIFLVVRMQQRGKLFSLLQIIQKVLMIVFTIIFFWGLNDNFIVLIYAFVFSNLIVTIIGLLIEKNFWFQNNKGKQLKVSKSELIRFGYPLVFTFLITWIFQSFDRVFIKHFNGYEELGLYAAAFSIVALLNALQSAFTMFWVPVAYEKFNESSNNKEFFSKVSRLIAFVMLIISITLILSKDIIVFILGNDFRNASDIMPFLIFMPLLYTVSETTVLGINFLKKSKYHILIATICALVSLLSNLILVPNLGAIGAAISTAIAYFVFFLFRTYFSVKFYNNNYGVKKFLFCITNLAIFSLYASFHNPDAMYIFLGLENLICVFLCYLKDIKFIIPKKLFNR